MDWNINTEGKAKRHHFVPRFYLNNWSTYKSELVYFIRKKDPHHTFQKISTRDICLKNNLYTRRKGRVDIEESFFANVDAKAANALSIIIDKGFNYIDCDERIDFARFINTLHRRHPDLVNEMREFNESRRIQVLKHYEKEFIKTGIDHRHLCKKDKYDDSPAIMAYHADQGLEDIVYANWEVINTETQLKFLTSDSPLMLQKISGNETYGYSLPEVFLLVLPLSPCHLLLISNKKYAIDNMKKFQPRDLVIKVNIETIRKSKQIIISSESGLEKFVRKHTDG